MLSKGRNWLINILDVHLIEELHPISSLQPNKNKISFDTKLTALCERLNNEFMRLKFLPVLHGPLAVLGLVLCVVRVSGELAGMSADCVMWPAPVSGRGASLVRLVFLASELSFGTYNEKKVICVLACIYIYVLWTHCSASWFLFSIQVSPWYLKTKDQIINIVCSFFP